MEQIKIPAGYHSDLNLHDTQVAIKTVKDFFQQTLSQKLNLLRVSAPVFVSPSSGLNDNLNGVERPVSFDIKGQEENAEIVHSLAKWKRYALKKYGFAHGDSDDGGADGRRGGTVEISGGASEGSLREICRDPHQRRTAFERGSSYETGWSG